MNKKLTFDLGAITWIVVEDKRTDVAGETHPDKNMIILSNIFNKEQQTLAFYHELTHAILHTMGADLYSNEEFVNTFSAFLHQAMKTKNYIKEK